MTYDCTPATCEDRYSDIDLSAFVSPLQLLGERLAMARITWRGEDLSKHFIVDQHDGHLRVIDHDPAARALGDDVESRDVHEFPDAAAAAAWIIASRPTA